MAAALEARLFGSLYDEAHTARAAGAAVPHWRASCALGHLLSECHDGGRDGGPSVHVALMAARMLREPRGATTVAAAKPLAERTLAATSYVSAVAVMALGAASASTSDRDPDPAGVLVAVASPERVLFVRVPERNGTGGTRDDEHDSPDEAESTDVVAAPLPGLHPVALLPVAPAECLVVCRCGTMLCVALSHGSASATVVRRVAVPTATGDTAAGRWWWSAAMPWPRELLLFDDTARIHAVRIGGSDDAVSGPPRADEESGAATGRSVLLAGDAAGCCWQRGTACAEGVWCAADSRLDCGVRVVVFDERRLATRSSSPDAHDAPFPASAATSRVLITAVAFGPVGSLPAFDFSGDERRRAADIAVRLVTLQPPPTTGPSARAKPLPLGALLEGVAASMGGDDGMGRDVVTVALASALAPDLILARLDLRRHEEEYVARRNEAAAGHAAGMAAHSVGEGQLAILPLPSATASHATSTAWVGPHVRHPAWSADSQWRRRVAALPSFAHVTAMSAGADRFVIAVHDVAMC